MNSFTLRVDQKPKAKERPRVLPGGRTYTPKATATAEAVVRDAWRAAGGPCFDGPVSLSIDLDKNGYTITVAEIIGGSSLRGDLDNYVKLLSDGLNKVAYKDDKQVCLISAQKH